MALDEFLNDSANLHAREELFNHKLLYEMKAAAFVRGYHLQTYFSDVDHDGFDLIFDDGDNLRKIQLKTVGANADTGSWDIHKGILRPLPTNYEEMGFNFEGFWGVEGGVVLIEYVIDAKNAISSSYLFTDIYVINAIALGLIARHGNTKNAAIALRANIAAGSAKEQIAVARGLFVKVATPQNLLCLIGMHSDLPRPAWQRRVRSLSSEAWGPKGIMLETELTRFREDFPAVMKEATGLQDF